MRLEKGFTLLELLIVISIIGVLSTVVIVSLDKSRKNARNKAVIEQMFEYQKSLELSYASSGNYPGTDSSRKQRYCIGEGLTSGEQCMGTLTTGYSASTSLPIETVFLSHMSILPRFNQIQGSLNFSSPAYSGCIGTGLSNTRCSSNDYSIWFVLEGVGEDCGRAEVAQNNILNTYTLCRLMWR